MPSVDGIKNQLIQGTSTWNKFDETINVKRNQRSDKQHPESWNDIKCFKTLDRLIKGKVKKSPGKDL